MRFGKEDAGSTMAFHKSARASRVNTGEIQMAPVARILW